MLPGRPRGELTEFVGRRSELAPVRQGLGDARLVTLTGPGGIGKTRLALQAAAGVRRAFADGVWLAELGGLRDPALLVPEVARSLGLSDRSGRWAVAALADYLHGKQVLLVLDGCEHLADGRGEERRVGLAARQRRVGQGLGCADPPPAAQHLLAGRRMWWPSRLARTPDPAPAELSQERASALTTA